MTADDNVKFLKSSWECKIDKHFFYEYNNNVQSTITFLKTQALEQLE